MAYFNQKMKAEKAPKIKAILKKYGLKGSIGVNNHSTLYVNLTSGELDFIENFNKVGGKFCERKCVKFYPVEDGYIQVNTHWLETSFDGKALECLEELYEVMMDGNHDNSDIMTDYFDVGWYVDINIGKWNKPYVCTLEVLNA